MNKEHSITDDERAQQEEELVNNAFQTLLDSYLSSPHRKKIDKITKAFNFAKQAHKGVRRLSGEPYIMHPIAVAMIASSEMGLGSTSICAALLHDVVEDTDYTVEDIENIFGSKIAQIVDGLTKISGGIFGEQASAQAENFKKLLLTMSDDIRVILIKICDRLHNMRTLASQPANKQYKIAGETLYIYAPLANRLGLNKIKNELEDLSFRYEHPEEYQNIKNKLKSIEGSLNEQFDQFTEPIREALDKMGFQYVLKARVKSPYSIWTKMQNKHVTFDQIYDILAVRIIFTPKNREDEINECFQIYVAINKIYKSHPDRMRDWVNNPKANGYQAIHLTQMSKQGNWIEVQIRSDRMNEIAEQGFAAHWKYKEGSVVTEDEGELNDWLRTIKEILDDPQPDAMDFQSNLCAETKQSRTYRGLENCKNTERFLWIKTGKDTWMNEEIAEGLYGAMGCRKEILELRDAGHLPIEAEMTDRLRDAREMQRVASRQPFTLPSKAVPPIGINTAPVSLYVFYVKARLVPVHDTLQRADSMQVIPHTKYSQTVSVICLERISHVHVDNWGLLLCLRSNSNEDEYPQQEKTFLHTFRLFSPSLSAPTSRGIRQRQGSS